MFNGNASLFFNTKKIKSFEQWNEQDFKRDFEAELSKIEPDVPVCLIIRGLPGSGKTFIGDFIASNVLKCQSIDIDKLRIRGKTLLDPHPQGIDHEIMHETVLAAFHLGVNVVVTGVFPRISDFNRYTDREYNNFVLEIYIDTEKSKNCNINEVPEELIEKYADHWQSLSSLQNDAKLIKIGDQENAADL